MIYLTSDLHLSHNRDFLYEPRGFNSIEEHDAAILARWNSIITDEDEVYVLGDLALNDVAAAIEKIKQLKGKIHLIRGNHCTDAKIEKYKDLSNIIDIQYATMIKFHKWSFYLSHYPTMMGNTLDQSHLWNLSGHTHSKDKFQYGQYKIYNVACDAHNCFPVSIEDILNDIRDYKTRCNNDKNCTFENFMI